MAKIAVSAAQASNMLLRRGYETASLAA